MFITAQCILFHIPLKNIIGSKQCILHTVFSKLVLYSEQAFDSADQKEQAFHSQRVMMMMLAHIVHFTAPEETAGATNPLISLHPCVILTPSLSIPRSCCSRSVSVYYCHLHSEAMEAFCVLPSCPISLTHNKTLQIRK